MESLKVSESKPKIPCKAPGTPATAKAASKPVFEESPTVLALRRRAKAKVAAKTAAPPTPSASSSKDRPKKRLHRWIIEPEEENPSERVVRAKE